MEEKKVFDFLKMIAAGHFNDLKSLNNKTKTRPKKGASHKAHVRKIKKRQAQRKFYASLRGKRQKKNNWPRGLR